MEAWGGTFLEADTVIRGGLTKTPIITVFSRWFKEASFTDVAEVEFIGPAVGHLG